MGARTLLTGALFGAGAMYFLDPRLGNRRRALALDQLHRLSRQTTDALDIAWRDLENRAIGTAAELQGLLASHDASDDVIAQRVRTRAGRVVAHPGALEVDVADGCVMLRGIVLRHEAEPLVCAVRHVPGVRSVRDQLDLRDEPGNVSSLQGEQAAGAQCAGWAGNWAPATRLLAAGIGGAMLLNCLASRRTAAALLGGFLGTGLLTRALANRHLGEALGMSAHGRPIDVQKTIVIDAPIDEVFNFFAQPKNYERISGLITKVETRAGGGFTKHMTIAGVPVRFEERITRRQPSERIESHSEPGSPFTYSKEICCERTGGGTRVHVLFSYHPPGGVVAHAAAAALGFDPKHVLDDLMMRAKSLLEADHAAHDHRGDGSRRQAAVASAAAAGSSTGPLAASSAPARGAEAQSLSRGAAWPQPSGQVPPAA